LIEVNRIVEHQASLSSYRATQDEERAIQLELLIEYTKPKIPTLDWHYLISTPFRYSPPHPNARFRPPFSRRNVFFGALHTDTAFYEFAYHFMKQRIHLNADSETGQRTLFSVEANPIAAIRIHEHIDCQKITAKNNYTASHEFIENNPQVTFILYPSCRDPEQRDNAAILDIQHLEKNPKWETSLKFFYDFKKQELTWIDKSLHIRWESLHQPDE
jgi:hypothetical protein